MDPRGVLGSRKKNTDGGYAHSPCAGLVWRRPSAAVFIGSNVFSPPDNSPNQPGFLSCLPMILDGLHHTGFLLLVTTRYMRWSMPGPEFRPMMDRPVNYLLLGLFD